MVCGPLGFNIFTNPIVINRHFDITHQIRTIILISTMFVVLECRHLFFVKFFNIFVFGILTYADQFACEYLCFFGVLHNRPEARTIMSRQMLANVAI